MMKYFKRSNEIINLKINILEITKSKINTIQK